jgi:hypothetical protein
LHGDTAIAARKRPGGDVARRKDQPDDLRVLRVANVDAEALDLAHIVRAGTVGGREDAVQRLARTEDKADATGHIA